MLGRWFVGQLLVQMLQRHAVTGTISLGEPSRHRSAMLHVGVAAVLELRTNFSDFDLETSDRSQSACVF